MVSPWCFILIWGQDEKTKTKRTKAVNPKNKVQRRPAPPPPTAHPSPSCHTLRSQVSMSAGVSRLTLAHLTCHPAFWRILCTWTDHFPQSPCPVGRGWSTARPPDCDRDAHGVWVRFMTWQIAARLTPGAKVSHIYTDIPTYTLLYHNWSQCPL